MPLSVSQGLMKPLRNTSAKPDPLKRRTTACMAVPPPEIHSKTFPLTLKLRTTPPDWYHKPRKSPPLTESLPAPTGPYFFYGTLTDPYLVSEILGLDHEPAFRPAYIVGYKCKLWGQYPALLDAAPDSIVKGAVYHVSTAEDAKKPAAYETSNYRLENCWIEYMDGEPAREMVYV
ncbi:conserved hypothetical protein [Talaromyces stipitatus ATCC 10500]|uniref:Putative gamma-glutamylcyclotransferase n=1 Tax=Talaromyces stipitatus (strain ATCC 10500 / CBS 375.48 / QM 6759 / NRRL 1006) TaxID=441959 RepID=B8MMS0_TALSN|nr:uncharacterized protein TSTA_100700 [Talaromyces stipitatus ATCC 10500]EED13826.1 conserved hypothetical protein [Talaromyces stipitatus ATCC 10500]